MNVQRRPPFHQRKFWILPDFQGRMVRSWALLSVASAATTSVALLTLLALARYSLNQEYVFVEVPKVALDALGDAHFIKVSNIVLISFLAAAVLGCLIAIVAGVFYSHRIAGPLFRIRRTLGESIEGKPVEPIILRDTDELKELADDINRVLRTRKD